MRRTWLDDWLKHMTYAVTCGIGAVLLMLAFRSDIQRMYSAGLFGYVRPSILAVFVLVTTATFAGLMSAENQPPPKEKPIVMGVQLYLKYEEKPHHQELLKVLPAKSWKQLTDFAHHWMAGGDLTYRALTGKDGIFTADGWAKFSQALEQNGLVRSRVPGAPKQGIERMKKGDRVFKEIASGSPIFLGPVSKSAGLTPGTQQTHRKLTGN